MKLADFAEERGVKKETILKYMQRHDNLFKGHTHKENNAFVLDEIATEILNLKYPVPVQIIEDIETKKELEQAKKYIDELQKKIMQMQDKYIDLSDKYIEIEKKSFSLEDKEKLEKERNEAIQEKEKVLDELLKMKNRNLFQRIINK